jgi:hypothetical protein
VPALDDHVAQDVRAVVDDPVDAEVEQAAHVGRVVDGPHLSARAVRRRDGRRGDAGDAAVVLGELDRL